jgi:hypothetical protein
MVVWVEGNPSQNGGGYEEAHCHCIAHWVLLDTPHTIAEAQRGWLITAGQGWGPVHLDMTEQDVLRVMGQPQRGDTSGAAIHFFSTLNLPIVSSATKW